MSGNPWRGGPRAKIFIFGRIPATSGNYLDRDTDLPPLNKLGKISRGGLPPRSATVQLVSKTRKNPRNDLQQFLRGHKRTSRSVQFVFLQA